MAQELTVQEYFNEVKSSQPDLDNMRYGYAKSYFNSLDLKTSFKVFLLNYCAEFNVTISVAMNLFANIWLSKLAEDDLLEFVAEKGVQAREAILDDDMEQKKSKINNYSHEPIYKSVDELKELVDIYLVHQVDRPKSIGLKSVNPFEKTGPPAPKTDLDLLNEDQWTEYKNREAENELKTKMLLESSDVYVADNGADYVSEEDDDDDDSANDYLGAHSGFKNVWRSPGKFKGSESFINPDKSDYENFYD